MGLRPTQGDEKRLPFSNYSSLEAPPSPLSSRPERIEVEGSAVSGPSWKCFSTGAKRRDLLCALRLSQILPQHEHPSRSQRQGNVISNGGVQANKSIKSPQQMQYKGTGGNRCPPGLQQEQIIPVEHFAQA
jgi:hypothetical protein